MSLYIYIYISSKFCLGENHWIIVSEYSREEIEEQIFQTLLPKHFKGDHIKPYFKVFLFCSIVLRISPDC